MLRPALYFVALLIGAMMFSSSAMAQGLSEGKFAILLESRQFLPDRLSPEELNARLELLRDKHVLVQFDHIPTEAEKATLESEGFKLVSYIPNYSWQIKLTAQSIKPSHGIRYIAAIEPDDKVSPNIIENGIAPKGMVDETRAKVIAIFFSDVTAEEIESLLADYGEGVNIFMDVWEVTLEADRLFEFASHDFVQWIENVPPEKIAHLDVVRSTIHANQVQTSPYNLHGNGYVAAMWDAGAAYSHTDYSSRLTVADGSSSNYHATLVAGAMAGNGSRSSSCGGYSFQWRGIATQADIISYDWTNPVAEHSSAINAYGADVSQNSWGWDDCNPSYCYRFGDYDTYSRSYDMIVRGSYGAKMTVVASAGNDGTCSICSSSLPNYPYGTVGGPIATSKNALSVSGTHANGDGLWTSSSRGPTDDGRIKPDLAAPACKTYDGIKTTWTNNCYNSDYCGTSFSAPVVSGSVILIYEEYNNFYGTDPWPSTVRGLLYHSARDLGSLGPDYVYGYGRINIQDAVDLIIADAGQHLRIIQDQVSNSQTDIYNILVESGQDELKVTVVWDDKEASAGGGIKLVNNLNLLLKSPSQTNYYPWVLNSSSPSSPATTGIDSRNNMEQVFVDNPEAGIWTVQVTGSTVPYGPQQYSLIGDFGEYTGSVTGTVRDISTSNPIDGVYVQALNTSADDYTDINGQYTLVGLDPGAYDISFSHPDYYDSTIIGVAVTTHDTTVLDVYLRHLPEADVGVVSIISPPDSLDIGMTYPLQSEIFNYGTASQTFDIVFEIYVSGSLTLELADTATIVNLPRDSLRTVTFSKTLEPDMGINYELVSYTTLAIDQNTDNDTSAATSYSHSGVAVWYGNIDGSPLMAFVDNRLYVDVYIQGSENAYIAYAHLCLGTHDQYIDSLLSDVEGQFYFPLSDWDDFGFLAPQGSPPNPAGWSSQSFLGWADIYGDPNPWLHFETPTKILTFVTKTVNDSSLIGDTTQCLGPGINSVLGPSELVDTLGVESYALLEQFSPVFFLEALPGCDYVPGDINGDGSVLGSDVTFGVRYFKGLGPPPPDSCFNEISGSWLYSAGDANGSCDFLGSDITYMVAFFKGNQPAIQWCIWTPPSGPMPPARDDELVPAAED